MEVKPQLCRKAPQYYQPPHRPLKLDQGRRPCILCLCDLLCCLICIFSIFLIFFLLKTGRRVHPRLVRLRMRQIPLHLYFIHGHVIALLLQFGQSAYAFAHFVKVVFASPFALLLEFMLQFGDLYLFLYEIVLIVLPNLPLFKVQDLLFRVLYRCS